MTRFDMLVQLDVKLASEIIFDIARKFETPELLQNHLMGHIKEKELQKINAAALEEGSYTLSFDADNKNSCNSLNKKEAGKIRKFDVLTSITGIREFSRLAFLMAKEAESAEMLEEELCKEVTGKKLQTILSVAKSGNYPLSLEGIQ